MNSGDFPIEFVSKKRTWSNHSNGANRGRVLSHHQKNRHIYQSSHNYHNNHNRRKPTHQAFHSNQLAASLSAQSYCDPWKHLVNRLVQEGQLPSSELAVDYSFVPQSSSIYIPVQYDLPPSPNASIPDPVPDKNEIDIDI